MRATGIIESKPVIKLGRGSDAPVMNITPDHRTTEAEMNYSPFPMPIDNRPMRILLHHRRSNEWSNFNLDVEQMQQQRHPANGGDENVMSGFGVVRNSRVEQQM